MGNKQHISEMIDIFLADYPKALQGLEKQVAAKDWLETEKAAHRLKSSFRVMGLDDLVSFSDRIEKNARNQSNWVEILNIVETIKSAARQPLDFFTNERKKRLSVIRNH